MQILVHKTRCSGCRACEIACVARHDGRFGTASARVRVAKIEAQGVDRPSMCRQCADAPCITACPAGALNRREATGAILLTAADCIVCPACTDACPFDAVFIDPITSLPLVCDLCDGDPACVRRCVTGALTSSRSIEGPGSEGQTDPRAAEDDRV